MKIKKITAMIIAFTMILGLFAVTEVFATGPIITHYFEPVDGEVITISIDVMQTGEGIYGIEFSSPKNINTPKDTTNLVPYGMIRFYNEQLLFRANGGWIAPNQLSQSGISSVKFTENEWHNIKLRVTRSERLAELYLDEEYAGSMNLLNELINPAHLIRVFSQGEKNFEMNFVSAVASEKGEMSAVIDNIDTENKEITVTFSETVNNAEMLNDAFASAVNCADGEHIMGLSVLDVDGSIVTFGYDEELLPANEYAVVFPEGLIGKNGGILKNRYLYFKTENLKTVLTDSECDYENGEATFWVEQPSGVNTIVDTGDEHGKAFYVRARKNSDDNMTIYGFNPPTEEISSISFDLQPRKANLKAIMEVWSPSASSYPISIVFGESGYILCKRDSWLTGAWLTQPNDETNAYAKDVIGSYQNKEWINFKITFDKSQKIAKVYMNGELKMEFDSANMANYAEFDHLRYIFSAQGNVRSALLYMDNIKGEVEKNVPSVSETRFNSAMGKSYGGAETVSRLIESVDVKFSAAMDELSLDSNTVKLLYDGVEVSYSGEYDADENLFRIYPETVPYADAEISVEVYGAVNEEGVEVLPYVLNTVADSTVDGLQVFEMAFVDGDGERVGEITSGEIYAKTVIANLTEDDYDILVSAMGYQDKALKRFACETETVKANSVYVIDEVNNCLSISTSGTDCAMLMIQDANTNVPFVEDYKIDRADSEPVEGELKISGEAYGETVVEVYAPDKAFEDIESAADFRDVLLYKTQFFAEGEYEIDFNIAYNNAKSGMYIIKTSNEDDSDSYEFLYVNEADAEEVFETLLKPAVDGGDVAEIGTVLLENNFDLYVDDRYIDEAVATRAAQIIVNEGVTFENAETVINKAVAISALEQGKIENILAEGEIYDLDNSAIAELYDASYVREATAERLMRHMSGKTFDLFEDFDEQLKEAFVLAVVKNPTEPSCVKTVLNAVGIKAKSDKAYAAVAGESFASIKKLEAALSKADSANSGSSGGGGGGGGSSSGCGAGGNPSTKVENNTIVIDEIAVEVDISSTKTENKYFDDIENVEWAKEAINALAERNIVNGKYDKHFCPNDNITREEFTKLIVSALNINGGAELNFTDTDSDAWYYDFVSRAFGAGIVNGYSDGSFGVGNKITRAEMAVMIYRGAVKAGIVLSLPEVSAKFADDSYIMDYAKAPVYSLKNSGIISGRDGGNFEPNAFATRAEAAKMIYNILNK